MFMTLQGTPCTDDLAILIDIFIDSADAVHRLQWFRRYDFRPAEHKVKNYDIIQDICVSSSRDQQCRYEFSL